METFTVGVDVGGTHVRFGLLGADGTLHSVCKRPRADVLPDEEPAKLGDVLHEYIAEQGVPVSAVGIGIPGTLSRDCSTTLKVPNVPALNGLPLADMLSRRAGVPVKLENDTVMLLTGDQYRLGLQPEGLVAGVYIGTGLGSAIFYDGKPLKGHNGLNELGHFPVPGSRERCTCGNVGCAENLVSGRYLQALRERLWPETHISRLFTEHGDAPEIQAFLDTAACILAGVVNLLDPEALIVSGGVPAMADFPRAALEAAVREKCMKPRPAETLRLLWSEGADDAGVLGAALFAR